MSETLAVLKKMVEEPHRAKMNTNGVVRVGGGRGFVMEHRVYFDFGDGNGTGNFAAT